MGTPYKMKGSPMQRNFGIGSPLTQSSKPQKTKDSVEKKEKYIQPQDEVDAGFSVEESKQYTEFGGYQKYVDDWINKPNQKKSPVKDAMVTSADTNIFGKPSLKKAAKRKKIETEIATQDANASVQTERSRSAGYSTGESRTVGPKGEVQW